MCVCVCVCVCCASSYVVTDSIKEAAKSCACVYVADDLSEQMIDMCVAMLPDGTSDRVVCVWYR